MKLIEKMNGYIYIRYHPSYEDACKLGKTVNIPDRDSQYATGEIKRGWFEDVFEIPLTKMSLIERLLQYEFREYNVKYDAGTEFYNKKIGSLVEPYLITLGLVYKKLSKQEISDLVRCNRVRNTITKMKECLLKRNVYTPKSYQTVIINKSVTHFQQKDKGLLVLTCGVGKTLISLWITQGLHSNTVLIGVPNKLLLKQWEEMVCILFPNVPCLIVSGGVESIDITNFLEKNKKLIVITTYSSAYKVYDSTRTFVFDMKINDECHHLTSQYDTYAKTYIQMLHIPSIKQLSLTATLKYVEHASISNDNIDYFGEVIDKKCLLWAINEKIVCDYMIQTIISNNFEMEMKVEYDKRLLLSAFVSLKSISEGHSHHILIYANNKDHSLKIIECIRSLLDQFDIPGLYFSHYHSDMKSTEQIDILSKFKMCPVGIISCVYCLGEGWDFPLLDGVVFAENMSSNIRIVQSALRASRKNKNQPNKVTKIILPVLDHLDDHDLKKVREVIYQMGLEDETVIQKSKVFKINSEAKGRTTLTKKNEFAYDDELTTQLRLKTMKRTMMGITYEKAKQIISDKRIKSKEEYYKVCEHDTRLSDEPDIMYKGQFINWIDYLSIDRVYYELEICKRKVDEYLVLHPTIKQHYLDMSMVVYELCQLDPLFPPNGLWVEYYNVNDIRDIITIKHKKKIGIK